MDVSMKWCHLRSRCSCSAIVDRLLMWNRCTVVCCEISSKPWSPSIWHLLAKIRHAPTLNYEEPVIRLQRILPSGDETCH